MYLNHIQNSRGTCNVIFVTYIHQKTIFWGVLGFGFIFLSTLLSNSSDDDFH
jgi:hypothetical protein